jgi:hypothetical protein
MKLRMCIAVLVVLAAGRANAEPMSLPAWSEGTLSRLPFHGGVMTQQGYHGMASSFADEKRHYFDDVFGRLVRKAEERGGGRRADELREYHARRLADLDAYVDHTTASLLSLLDPDGDGVVHEDEARPLLLDVAAAADLDGDGYLDDSEQQLAEWSIATGTKLADKNDKRGLRRQARAMDDMQW